MKLIKELLHTTDAYINRLAWAGIVTIEDFIGMVPRVYEDKSKVIESFSYVNLKSKNTLRVTIESIVEEITKNGKKLIKAIIKDANGMYSEAVWFNQSYLLRQFKKWATVILFWKPKYEYGKLTFVSPDIKADTKDRTLIEPVYSELGGIPSAWFSDKMSYLIPYFPSIADGLPEVFRKQKKFLPKSEALKNLHFPESSEAYERARSELAYEELFRLQYQGILRKIARKSDSKERTFSTQLSPDTVKSILANIPYTLTDKQRIVLFQILKDMEADTAMNRLLEGDVGTGKTVVAAIAMLHMLLLNPESQCAFLAPTEILVQQHVKSLGKLFESLGIDLHLMTGSIKESEKRRIKDALATGQIRAIIGTHALLESDVKWKHLALVVIDEQHRFWVEQRKVLERYGNAESIFPHILHMTATPIPRTLALTLFWDQDISLLDEYPKGRIPIHTRVVKENKRQEAYRFIDGELKKWHQVYWISPLVEESESLDIQSATNMKEILSGTFPENNIWLLHGRMKAWEKESIMSDFYSGKIHILSSTSVVEVWVDNPNATVICIEGAERFWLSQLHQFRGRVWRGNMASYCFLFPSREYVGERLLAMERTNNGFELAEMDLELRWPWEVMGTRQSGELDLKLANARDLDLVESIREDIEAWMKMKA